MSTKAEFMRLLTDEVEPAELALPVEKWKKYRYLVFCYYKHLDIPIRVTGYSTKQDMYEFLSGVRMCDTPYQAIDQKEGRVIDRDFFGADEDEIAEMILTTFTKENG